jgi:hypothetical protein
MKSDRLIRSYLFCLSLMLLTYAGCQAQGTAPAAGDSASVEDHHGIPEHKPKTFAKGVATLAERLKAWPKSGEAIDREELTLVTDIVRWLPELAADTDLQRADWEQVAAISKRFDEALGAKQIDVNMCQRFAEELQPLVTLVGDATTTGTLNEETATGGSADNKPLPVPPQRDSTGGTNG